MASIPPGDWNQLTSNDVADRRASGRRAYNARRRFQQAHRRFLLGKSFTYRQGDIIRFAKALGVTRRTIYSDLRSFGLTVGWQSIGRPANGKERCQLDRLLNRLESGQDGEELDL